jgi:hypothetical protein
MRIRGTILMLAGVVGALAGPLLGLPGAFPVLLPVALVLWFVGTTTAAVCLAPPRRTPGLAALAASLLGWPLLLLYGLAPLWGALAAVCGVLVAIRRPHSPARAGGLHPSAR